MIICYEVEWQMNNYQFSKAKPLELFLEKKNPTWKRQSVQINKLHKSHFTFMIQKTPLQTHNHSIPIVQLTWAVYEFILLRLQVDVIFFVAEKLWYIFWRAKWHKKNCTDLRPHKREGNKNHFRITQIIIHINYNWLICVWHQFIESFN